MKKPLLAFSLLIVASMLGAQVPELLPGEGLAMISPSGEVQTWGDVDTVIPMGGAAKLLWLRLEAAEWSTFGLEARCKGEIGGIRCDAPKGHGRVDLPKSFRMDCNAAFGVWVNISRNRWTRDYGEGGARLRMNEVFGPFLGDRLPASQSLPQRFGTEWFADGHLLQASANQLAQWLAKPAQEPLLGTCRRYLLGFSDFIRGKGDKWWIKAFDAPSSDSTQKQAWVLGGNANTTVLLRLPPGSTQKDGEARYKALMGIQK